jgi:hypothetical protein
MITGMLTYCSPRCALCASTRFACFAQDREFLRSTMWPLKLDDHLLVPVGIQRLIWNAQVCWLSGFRGRQRQNESNNNSDRKYQ